MLARSYKLPPLWETQGDAIKSPIKKVTFLVDLKIKVYIISCVVRNYIFFNKEELKMPKLNLDEFQGLMSNGVMLDAIVEEYGEEELKSVLVEYVAEMEEETDENFKDEYLFYEEEDCEVLQRLGFDNLIAA